MRFKIDGIISPDELLEHVSDFCNMLKEEGINQVFGANLYLRCMRNSKQVEPRVEDKLHDVTLVSHAKAKFDDPDAEIDLTGSYKMRPNTRFMSSQEIKIRVQEIARMQAIEEDRLRKEYEQKRETRDQQLKQEAKERKEASELGKLYAEIARDILVNKLDSSVEELKKHERSFGWVKTQDYLDKHYSSELTAPVFRYSINHEEDIDHYFFDEDGDYVGYVKS